MLSKLRIYGLEYLDSRHFALAIVGALFLHMTAAAGYYIAPKTQVIDVPVRALNIRLGDADVVVEHEQAAQPASANTAQVEDAMNKLVRPAEQEKPVVKEQPKIVTKVPVAKPNEVDSKSLSSAGILAAPRQYVRDDRRKKDGSILGNSKGSTAEIRSRYEQTISLWILRFTIPQKMQGNATVRIRIDRRGNIRYSALEQSSGKVELDRAALDMVRRANPVPAVPDNYPAGEMFEFLIPVNFTIR